MLRRVSGDKKKKSRRVEKTAMEELNNLYSSQFSIGVITSRMGRTGHAECMWEIRNLNI
jgi:hypothetical protein